MTRSYNALSVLSFGISLWGVKAFGGTAWAWQKADLSWKKSSWTARRCLCVCAAAVLRCMHFTGWCFHWWYPLSCCLVLCFGDESSHMQRGKRVKVQFSFSSIFHFSFALCCLRTSVLPLLPDVSLWVLPHPLSLPPAVGCILFGSLLSFQMTRTSMRREKRKEEPREQLLCQQLLCKKKNKQWPSLKHPGGTDSYCCPARDLPFLLMQQNK